MMWGSDALRKALEGHTFRGSDGILKALKKTLIVYFLWAGTGWQCGREGKSHPVSTQEASGGLRMLRDSPPVVRS